MMLCLLLSVLNPLDLFETIEIFKVTGLAISKLYTIRNIVGYTEYTYVTFWLSYIESVIQTPAKGTESDEFNLCQYIDINVLLILDEEAEFPVNS